MANRQFHDLRVRIDLKVFLAARKKAGKTPLSQYINRVLYEDAKKEYDELPIELSPLFGTNPPYTQPPHELAE